ncbi:hypothetical protein HY498_01780 [Candidatus Woesearchaeota archaeon]|nr:hypothetical protein [Candidatus Woesearchaeota archaeon]MBI4154796.1 hypothetical protein [Candidatus Woesearchaeota archaeon]
MDQNLIKNYLEKGSLVKRSPDINIANSLIQVAKITANSVLEIPLKESNAIVIFRELYEVLRQIGDAKLWKMGYEARQHEPSIKVLMDVKIKNSFVLNNLDRFRMIRNDMNYRGFKPTLNQSQEILDFWKKYGKEFLEWVKS